MFACLTGCSPCGKCFPLGTAKKQKIKYTNLVFRFLSGLDIFVCCYLPALFACSEAATRGLCGAFFRICNVTFSRLFSCVCVRACVCFLAIFLSAQFINFADQQQQQQHQEICHAGRRIIKYFHLCRPAVYADADALCLWIDSWPNPKLAKPMHFK